MSRPFNEFHRRALSALARDIAQARIGQREGGAHIDTHECPMCRPAGCSGDCEQGRRECDCQVGQSQMPSPLDPQPVQVAKPSRFARWWKRVQDWWIGDEE